MSLLKVFPVLEPLGVAVERVVGEPPPRGVEALLGDPRIVGRAVEAVSSIAEGRYPWGGSDSVDEALGSSVLFFLLAVVAGGQASARLLDGLGRALGEVVHGLEARRLVEVLEYAGVRVERGGISIPWFEVPGSGVLPLLLQWRVHVSQFLGIASGSEEPLLALSNQFLLSGWVYLEVSRLRALAVRALLVAAKKRLVEAESLLVEWEPPEPLRRLAVLARLRLGGERLPFINEVLPPCIVRILGKLETGRQISDEEAYTILTFLARLEIPEAEEERLASLLGLTREQFKRALALAAGYPVPPCRRLSEAGVCRCRGSLLEAYRRRLEEALSPLAHATNP